MQINNLKSQEASLELSKGFPRGSRAPWPACQVLDIHAQEFLGIYVNRWMFENVQKSMKINENMYVNQLESM